MMYNFEIEETWIKGSPKSKPKGNTEVIYNAIQMETGCTDLQKLKWQSTDLF